MVVTPFLDNHTIIMNTTEDHFCVKLFVGPLILAVFCVPCACVGVPASVWLLWVLIQRQRSGESTKIYMLNLTIMDLIYNIFKLLGIFNFLLWHDVIFLNLCFFLEGFNLNGRTLLMACSCVDCYMAVVHPIRYMRISQSRYREVVCALVWVFMLMFGLPVQLMLPHAFVIGIPRILSIFTISLCDLLIFRTLRKLDPSGRSEVHPQKQRALQTITNSFIMTLVSYLPSLVVTMCASFIRITPSQLLCNFLLPVSANSALGSTLLPLLYLSNMGKLAGFKRFGCSREQ